MAKSSTSQYYKKNPKAAARRRKQQAKYNKTAKGLMIRTAANKLNRKLGTYGNKDGKDSCHTKKGNKTCSRRANRRKKGIHA